MALLNSACYNLIQKEEGFRLNAYPDGNAYAIGFGNQFYANGRAVQKGDTITKPAAIVLMQFWAEKYAAEIVNRIGVGRLNINQLGALTSMLYNRGGKAFFSSATYKIALANSNDARLKTQIVADWGSATKYKTALQNRRKREAAFYFTGTMVVPTNSTDNTVFFIGAGLALLFISYQIFKNNGNETETVELAEQ